MDQDNEVSTRARTIGQVLWGSKNALVAFYRELPTASSQDSFCTELAPIIALIDTSARDSTAMQGSLYDAVWALKGSFIELFRGDPSSSWREFKQALQHIVEITLAHPAANPL